jgi:capsular polysaccharide biosynthesis protein
LVPRAFLLHHPRYQEIDQIKLLYTQPFSEIESLLLPGLIPENTQLTQIQPGRFCHIEKLILPTFLTQFGSGYLPAPFIQKLRDSFLPKRPSTKSHRIYISRAKSANSLKKRHILNEEELFDALKSMGFERYQLEDFSLQEKIELFYDAETVVGAYGGGLTHILFSDKINVLELQVMRKTQTYYYYLAKCLGHPYHFWYSNKGNNRENFTVDIDEVITALREWHG